MVNDMYNYSRDYISIIYMHLPWYRMHIIYLSYTKHPEYQSTLRLCWNSYPLMLFYWVMILCNF